MANKDRVNDLLELHPRFCGLAEQVNQMEDGEEKERTKTILIGAANIYHTLLTWRKT